MRKIFWSILVIVLFLASSVAFAENEQGTSGKSDLANNEGNGEDEDTSDEVGDVEVKDENEADLVVSSQDKPNKTFSEMMKYRREIKQIKKESIKDLKEAIKSEKEDFKERVKNEYQNFSEKAKEKVQAEHRMNIFVKSLLDIKRLGNITGGIGQNVSEIAGKFNKSSGNIFELQEKMQNRNKLAKFFTGNKKLAKEMNREIEQNQNMLVELNRIKENCNCTEETKTLLGEQIKEMEQEQILLGQVAETESKKTGLFGWLF